MENPLLLHSEYGDSITIDGKYTTIRIASLAAAATLREVAQNMIEGFILANAEQLIAYRYNCLRQKGRPKFNLIGGGNRPDLKRYYLQASGQLEEENFPQFKKLPRGTHLLLIKKEVVIDTPEKIKEFLIKNKFEAINVNIKIEGEEKTVTLSKEKKYSEESIHCVFYYRDAKKGFIGPIEKEIKYSDFTKILL